MKKQINSNRSEKIASKVQTLVAEILQREFFDDKVLNSVSLVGAEAHGGMQFVKLFFYSHYEDKIVVQRRLNDVTKMIRFSLAKKLDQKYVPELKFIYDDTLEKADKIESLLKNINNE